MPKTKRRVKIGYGGLSGPVHEHPRSPRHDDAYRVPTFFDIEAERERIYALDRLENFGLMAGNVLRIAVVYPLMVFYYVMAILKFLIIHARDIALLAWSAFTIGGLIWVAYKLWEVWPNGR